MKAACMKLTISRVTYRLMGTKLLKRMKNVNHCPMSLDVVADSQFSLRCGGVPCGASGAGR